MRNPGSDLSGGPIFGPRRHAAVTVFALFALVAVTFNGLHAVHAANHTVVSPDRQVKVVVSHDPKSGTLRYSVRHRGAILLNRGTLGIMTNRGDFQQGLAFVEAQSRVVDETYRLPTGKRASLRNHANELELAFDKEGAELRVIFRAYDDGAAFRYVLPGTGPVELTGETTTFPFAAKPVVLFGQAHPNDYGYETALGPVDAERLSMPVLAELPKKVFVLIAQAASYGHYIIPNYVRAGNTLRVAFPLDQTEPVKTTLPFASPWRVAMVSRIHPGRIVESSLVEHLNPPTEAALAGADWIRAGRASWDFIAKDGDKLRTWIDFDSQMGWEYHVADAGWETRVPDMADIVRYGQSKNVGIVVWGKVANKTFLNTPERAEAWMADLAKLGVRGAKIDFFDQRNDSGEKTADLEDTQERLQVRDFLSEIAAKHRLLVEYHGCAIPSGERRRWPHLMSAEAVYGLERRKQNLEHDLTIPYVRNVMGPVSFTPVHFTRSIGTPAYQLGQAVIYEAGIQIFAERHDAILASPGVAFLKAVPAAWDEIHFVEGGPGRHTVLARRKADAWFVGGIFGKGRKAHRLALAFLPKGAAYRAEIYRDDPGSGDRTRLVREEKTVTSKDRLTLPIADAGGFALVLRPTDARP